MPLEVETSIYNKERSKNVDIKRILYDGYFYDVTDWIKRHPGGRIIEFYTKSGEDASLAIEQFHNRSMKKVSTILKSFKSSKVSSDEGKNYIFSMSQLLWPILGILLIFHNQAIHLCLFIWMMYYVVLEIDLSAETLRRHRALTKDFQKLHHDLEIEGYFKPSIPHIIYRILELVALAVTGFYLSGLQNWWFKSIGITLTAMFAGRCGWLMHEGGHHSLTSYPKVDRFLQSFIFGIGDGMSAAWWSNQHNRHHAMPQRLQHDVDLQTLPLIAFNKNIVKIPEHGKGIFVQNQSFLFLLVDTFLVSSLWKFYLHPKYAFKKRAYFDLIFMGFHYYYSLQNGIIQYLITAWLTSIYIFGNFALSHTHLPVTDEPLHWVEYSLLHTMDIQPSFWCDWWMSYLNYQIEHHLFPTMPQFRHPLIRNRVKALADRHSIPYHSTSYWDALKRTFRNLAEVSKDLKHVH